MTVRRLEHGFVGEGFDRPVVDRNIDHFFLVFHLRTPSSLTFLDRVKGTDLITGTAANADGLIDIMLFFDFPGNRVDRTDAYALGAAPACLIDVIAHEIFADTRRTTFVNDMGPVFVHEVFHGRQHRVRCGLS